MGTLNSISRTPLGPALAAPLGEVSALETFQVQKNNLPGLGPANQSALERCLP